MHIEVDQSGKIEQTAVDNVLRKMTGGCLRDTARIHPRTDYRGEAGPPSLFSEYHELYKLSNRLPKKKLGRMQTERISLRSPTNSS